MAYDVAQRAREFAIRAALGASGQNLVALISREIAWVVVAGFGVGLAGAWALTRIIASMLFGVTARDPTTFIFVPLGLLVPIGLAVLAPARRMLRVDPAKAMRAE